MNSLASKPLEIFSGTGGVGKTTLATSRAIHLAKNRRVLLITIDPAKRLKQVLGIQDDHQGIQKIQLSNFIDEASGDFDVLLMNPLETFRYIQAAFEKRELNFILKQLLGAYGGLNEIMSIIELNRHLESGNYDTIILDTPPGKNFVDFLKASQKIQSFFRPQFVKIISQLRDQSSKKSPKFLKQLVQSGIETLLKYLTKVTGEEFIESFIEALQDVYALTPEFQKAIQFQQKIENSDQANWFLVTSTDQGKIEAAINLYNKSIDFLPSGHSILVNKSLKIDISEDCDQQTLNFLNSLAQRQNQLTRELETHFSSIHAFSEVISSEPQKHVLSLAQQWQDKENKNNE